MQLLKLLEGTSLQRRYTALQASLFDLETVNLGLNTPIVNGDNEHIGVGLDSCVMPTRHSGLSLIQTTDLYPMIPYPLAT